MEYLIMSNQTVLSFGRIIAVSFCNTKAFDKSIVSIARNVIDCLNQYVEFMFQGGKRQLPCMPSTPSKSIPNMQSSGQRELINLGRQTVDVTRWLVWHSTGREAPLRTHLYLHRLSFFTSNCDMIQRRRYHSQSLSLKQIGHAGLQIFNTTIFMLCEYDK